MRRRWRSCGRWIVSGRFGIRKIEREYDFRVKSSCMETCRSFCFTQKFQKGFLEKIVA